MSAASERMPWENILLWMNTIMIFRGKRKFFVVLLTVLLFPLSVQATSGPTEQLRPTLSALTAILTNPQLKGEAKKTERRSKIMDCIKTEFNFREMSKRVLGPTWNRITDAQRDHFTSLMTRLLENVYIGKLESYSGQTIGYVGERVQGRRAQVSTLIEDKGTKIPVHYIMSMEDKKWMVYDINIEGVSLVRNYMQQFKSILRTDKFNGLIKILEKKNEALEAAQGRG